MLCPVLCPLIFRMIARPLSSPLCRQGNRGRERVSDLPKVTRPVRSRAGGQAQMETLDACRALAPGSWDQPVCLPPRRRVGQGASLGLRGAVRLSPFCHTAPLSGSQGARGNCPASPNQNRRPVGSAWSPAMPRGQPRAPASLSAQSASWARPSCWLQRAQPLGRWSPPENGGPW